MTDTEQEIWTIKAKPLHAALVKELVALAGIRWEQPEVERYLAGRGRLEPGPGLGLVFHTAGEGYWLMPTPGSWDASGELVDFDDESRFWMPFCWTEEAGGPMLAGWADNPFGLVDRSGTRAGFDAVWEAACEVVTAEIGPPLVTTTLDDYHRAIWRIGSTALFVGQDLDNFISQGDTELCLVQLAQYEEFPETEELVELFSE